MSDFLWVMTVVVLYFLPGLIAVRRGSATGPAAIVVDVFLGWTILGWIVALALAVSGRPRSER